MRREDNIIVEVWWPRTVDNKILVVAVVMRQSEGG